MTNLSMDTVGVAMMNAGETKKRTVRKRDLSRMVTGSGPRAEGWPEVGG